MEYYSAIKKNTFVARLLILLGGEPGTQGWWWLQASIRGEGFSPGAGWCRGEVLVYGKYYQTFNEE